MTGKGADMGQWFQRFVTSGLHGEVSDATIQGYLRSAGQIEEVWQQIDDSVETPILQGILGAAQQMRDWAAGLLAKYELALDAAKTPVPQAVATHLEEMKSELKLGDFHLRTGVDMVGQLSNRQVPDELGERAEGFLWEAMESFFKVSQLVANPEASAQLPRRAPTMVGHAQQYRDSHTSPQSDPGVPVQPSHDVSNMLNQVIAVPGATQEAPVQPSPDMPGMLNQVIAGPDATQGAPTQSSHAEPNTVNQEIERPGA